MFIKKTIILVLILALVFPLNVYSYSETSGVSDFSSDAFSVNEQDLLMDEFDFADANRTEQPVSDDECVDGVYTENTLTEETPRATTYSNGIIRIDSTEVVMSENSTVRIGYQILDPSYRIDFWYEGNRNFSMSTTGEELIITSHEPEVSLIMVHYINETNGNEGHFYINVTVYPQSGYVYINNIASGRCLDVRGAKAAVGTKTIIYAKYSSFKANQVWRIIPRYDGAVYLQSVLHPNRYLHINSTTSNVEIDTRKTAWYFYYNDSLECYKICTQSSFNSTDLYLSVKNDATAANSEVIANAGGSANSQKWSLSRISNYVPVSSVIITSPTTEASFTESLKDKDYEYMTIDFDAECYPSTVTNDALTWFSSNSSIATIDEKTGEAELKSAGIVTFTAKANDGTVYDSCCVNVISTFCYIKNYNSNRYFDIANSGTDEGTKLLHWSYHGASNQIMKIMREGFNTFSIHPLPSMNAMAIAITDQGVTLEQYDDTKNNQKFSINFASNTPHKCRIMPKGTANCLAQDNTENKRVISTATSASGTLAQEWTIESYESKALSTVNFAAYSISPDSDYDYLAYNTFISKMSRLSLNGTSYGKGSCWKASLPLELYGPYVLKEDILELLPYSDVVYIDSHATPSSIYLYYETDYEDEIYHSDICSGFLPGSTTVTDSIFNKRTKWIITSCCDQLNCDYDDLDSALYNWARAMLGDGTRLRGLLGYYHLSPGDQNMNGILNDFFSFQSNETEPMVDSWAEANTLFGTGCMWGALYGENYANDRLDTMDLTLETGEQFIMKVLFLNEYHDEFFDFSSLVPNRSTFAVENHAESINQAFKLCKQTPTKVYLTEDKTVSLTSQNDKIVYKNDNISIVSGKEIKKKNEEMTFDVYNFLSNAGVIYGNNYTVTCAPIVSKTLDMNDSICPVKKTEVLGYHYIFSQKDNITTGKRSDYHNTISVICTKDGISSFASYNAESINVESISKEAQ